MRAAGITKIEAAARREIIDERPAARQDMKDFAKSLALTIEGLRGDLIAEMANIKAETIKWVAGLLVAQAAVIAALVKLL
jgi:hypothetical protein